MKIRAFWDIASFSLVGVYRRFRGAYFNIRSVNSAAAVNVQLQLNALLSTNWLQGSNNDTIAIFI
jgi:hypothetical protein